MGCFMNYFECFLMLLSPAATNQVTIIFQVCTAETTKQREEVRLANALPESLHNFVSMTGPHKQPLPFWHKKHKQAFKEMQKKLHSSKRNHCDMCKAFTGSLSCHLLNPQPWQYGHGSTPALVAMGFHFPPNYDVRGACMLSNCYKEACRK